MKKELENIFNNITEIYDSNLEKIKPVYMEKYNKVLSGHSEKQQILSLLEEFFISPVFKEIRLAAIKGFLNGIEKNLDENIRVYNLDGKTREDYFLLNIDNKLSLKKFEMELKKNVLHFPFGFSGIKLENERASLSEEMFEVAMVLSEKYPDAPLTYESVAYENDETWNIMKASIMILEKIDATRLMSYKQLKNNSDVNENLLIHSFNNSQNKNLYVKRLFEGGDCWYERYCTTSDKGSKYKDNIYGDFFKLIFDYIKNNDKIMTDEIVTRLILLNNNAFNAENRSVGGCGNEGFFHYEHPNADPDEIKDFCTKYILNVLKKMGDEEIVEQLYNSHLYKENIGYEDLYAYFYTQVEGEKIKRGASSPFSVDEIEIKYLNNGKTEITFPKNFLTIIKSPNAYKLSKMMSGAGMLYDGIKINIDGSLKIKMTLALNGRNNLSKEDVSLSTKELFENMVSEENVNNLHYPENAVSVFLREMNLLNSLMQKDTRDKNKPKI